MCVGGACTLIADKFSCPGCKHLKVLDVACRGSTPFARHYEPSLVDSIVDSLPLLTELTIFGR